ncbi:MAG: hypothetical protein AAF108_03650 [Planctomycetota bacterium]
MPSRCPNRSSSRRPINQNARWVAVAAGVAAGFATLAGLLAAPGSRAATGSPLTDEIAMETTNAVSTADADAIDAAIKDLYAVISGPAGEARDWDRFHKQFAPEGRMSYTRPNGDGTFVLVVLTPDDYVTKIGPRLEEAGFVETETHRVLEVFGSVAHAFSTYHGVTEAQDGFEIRGINSIQLVKVGPAAGDEPQWKVLSITWHQKQDGEDIPAKYSPVGEL